MKKGFMRIVISLLGFILLFSLGACSGSNEEKRNMIPQNNIRYTYLEFGNVIDEGKQAVFFNFSSDYIVSEMEIAGVLLDINGNTIYTFDTTTTFGSPSKNPEPHIRIDANLIKNVVSASFTEIKAYTTEEVASS